MIRRLAAATVLAGLLAAVVPALLPLAVLAQETTTTTATGSEPAVGPTESTVTVSENPPAEIRTPAVTVVPDQPAEVEQPWTARYLVPTGLVLGALAVFVTAIQYFLRVVRGRYKVVE